MKYKLSAGHGEHGRDVRVILIITIVIITVIITTLSSVPGTANMGGTEAIAKAESSRGL